MDQQAMLKIVILPGEVWQYLARKNATTKS
jgi:hypothetical protein